MGVFSGFIGVILAVLCMVIGISIALGLLIYVVFGSIFAIVLTVRFCRAVLLREAYGPWSLVTGAGWFLLLGGMDLAFPESPLASVGVLMILSSFGIWMLAHRLQSRELA